MLSDPLNRYLDTVCAQIRWKQARPPVIDELRGHLEDQQAALIAEGMDEEAAAHKAVETMGDPLEIGRQLDRIHRPKPDVLMLTMLGILLLFSFIGFSCTSEPVQFWACAVVGVLIFPLAYFTDLSHWSRYPRRTLLGLCALMPMLYLLKILFDGYDTLPISPLMMLPVIFAVFVYSMKDKGKYAFITCSAVFTVFTFIPLLFKESTVCIIISIGNLSIMIGALNKGLFQGRLSNMKYRLFIVFGIQLVLPLGHIMALAQHPEDRALFLETHTTKQVAETSVKIVLPFFQNINIYWISYIQPLLFVILICYALYRSMNIKNNLFHLLSIAITMSLGLHYASIWGLIYVTRTIEYLTMPFVTLNRSMFLIEMLLIGLLLAIFRTEAPPKRKSYAAPSRVHYVKYEDG